MKIAYQLSLVICLLLSVQACTQSKIAVDNIEQAPKVQDADKAYADVYKALDGQWKGQFYIYNDTSLVAKDGNILNDISLSSLQRPSLKQVNVIEVEQVYSSDSPYFQKVEITDFYPEKNERVKSVGVNKVQDGKMWCVVHKPDDTVIHEGSMDGPETIIWQRNEQSPQRIEYFRETVRADSYTIIGWGYYEGDDPTLMPKYWFFGDYKRVK
ncbi:MAG: hypothetical protein MK226_05910 [Saprospiraceae bacterium]|nr:hypothetical protein [Saprospiraceae bacterium]